MRRQAVVAAAILTAAVAASAGRDAVAQTPAPSTGAPLMAPGPGGGMPNMAAISGRPLPDRGMPGGTVSVRVARKVPSNAVAGVEITAIIRNAGGDLRKRTAKTDEGGRALFEGMASGDQFRAEVTVDGERLATQTFAIPPEGGIRTMLVAGVSAGAVADAPAGQPGQAEGAGEDRGAAGFTLGATAGTAAPEPSLAAGTLEVRLSDEAGKPIPNHEVLLGMVDKSNQVAVRKATTDAAGVARYPGLPTGSVTGYAAVTKWRDMRLGTAPFAMPETGGMRADIRALGRTNDPSVVTIGSGARVVVQLQEDTLQFLEMLPLENRSEQIFDPSPGAIEIPLPKGFVGAQAQESDRKIEVRQNHGVAVHGAILPSKSIVSATSANEARRTGQEVAFGFVLPFHGSEREFEQPLPTGIGPFTLITEQAPGLTVTGPGIGARESRELGGRKYWVMAVDAIPAGGTLKFTLRGLPATDDTGRNVAGALTLALIAGAIVFGRDQRRAGAGAKAPGAGKNLDDERARLFDAREALYAELVALEGAARAAGQPSPADERKRLVGRLEQVYRDLAGLDVERAA